MKTFTIRTYGLKELAVLYFPHCTPSSASVQLKKWINHPMLLEKLLPCGYRHGQKLLTPRQVQMIVEHLGEP